MYTPTLHALTHMHTQAKAYTHSHSETHVQTQTHPHVHRQPVTPHADSPGSRPKSLYQAHLYPSLRNPQAAEELVCGCPLSTTHRLMGQEVVHTVPQPAARPPAGRPGITVAAERDPDRALGPQDLGPRPAECTCLHVPAHVCTHMHTQPHLCAYTRARAHTQSSQPHLFKLGSWISASVCRVSAASGTFLESQST